MPEWLPGIRRIEMQWMERIRQVYESYGYVPVETSAIEMLDVLTIKGEIDKEIYVVKKLHEDAKEEMGLHFDLTVPLARYVVQNAGQLTFPFKRYQMQKIWRGERPQRGRYREFYQCDIDVIDLNDLSLYYDFEVLFGGFKAMAALGIPAFEIGVSNRKIYEGYLEGIGIEDPTPVLRIIDKMDKVGEEGVSKMLKETLGLSDEIISKALKPSSIRSTDLGFVEQYKALGVSNPKADQGIAELTEVMTAVLLSDYQNVPLSDRQNAPLSDSQNNPKTPGSRTGGSDNLATDDLTSETEARNNRIVADLGFVRGFDYYTGTIFEGKFRNVEGFGSICSGGRYDNLAGRFTNQHMPGVGFSIGLSRIFGKMVEDNALDLSGENTIDCITLRINDEDLPKMLKLAAILRNRGFNVEVYPYTKKIQKQFAYVDKKKIPYAWVVSRDNPDLFEVKNMVTGEQVVADPETWGIEI